MRDADLVPVGDHLVPHRECGVLGGNHLTGEVDPRDDRISAHHTAARGDGQPVLEVRTRIVHLDRHRAGPEEIRTDLLAGQDDTAVLGLVRDHRLELHGFEHRCHPCPAAMAKTISGVLSARRPPHRPVPRLRTHPNPVCASRFAIPRHYRPDGRKRCAHRPGSAPPPARRVPARP